MSEEIKWVVKYHDRWKEDPDSYAMGWFSKEYITIYDSEKEMRKAVERFLKNSSTDYEHVEISKIQILENMVGRRRTNKPEITIS